MTQCILCSTDLYLERETCIHGIVHCQACGIDLEIAAVEPELVLQLSGDDIHWGE